MSSTSVSTRPRNFRLDRWRQQGRSFATEYFSQTSGVVGLIIMVLAVLVALLAPVMFPAHLLDVTATDLPANMPPSLEHPLGTDPRGIDVVALVAWGARASLLVGFAATGVSMVIGTVVGMAAGHFPGLIQGLLMRFIDFFLVIPSLVLAITLSAIIGPGIQTIIIAIGVTGWAGTARLVRSQTMTIENEAYLERATALGAGDAHILTKHVLPGVMPLVLAQTTLTVALSVIAESTLSFLGLGDPSTVSWGSMLKLATDSGAATAGYWWFVLAPGVAIVIVVLGFTLVGRAMESVFNPTLRGAK